MPNPAPHTAVIRPGQAADLPRILEIVAAAKKRMLSDGNPQWDSDYPGGREFMNDIARGELYLYEIPGSGKNSRPGSSRIYGFAAINREFPEEYKEVQWQTPLPSMSIHRLAVDPACPVKGVADALFAYAEHHAAEQGMRSIRLDTFSLNPRAPKLFLRCGYRYTGSIHMRGKTEPFFCYEKTLTRK